MLEEGEAGVVHRRGDDGFASQVFRRAHFLQLMESAHNDMRLADLGGDATALEITQGCFQHFAGATRQRPVAAFGIQLQLHQRCQHRRRAGLCQRVGKLQVGRVVGQGSGHVVVAHARHKQHQVVIEVVAQLVLHMAHSTHL